jgi:hypothetical protein
MTTIELKGRTPQEKGEHYLQLSLSALEELATLLEDGRLSENQRVSYYDIYETSKTQLDDMIELRKQLVSRKKSIAKFIINLFVPGSDAKRFHKITYRNFANIRRTSDDLHRLLLPDRNAIFGPRESAQGDVSVREESPRDVVEGNRLVKDLPPDEQLGGFTLDVRTEQEANKAIAMLIQMTTPKEKQEDDNDDDDDRTIRPPHSQSRPPSPSPSCTIIYNHYSINQSVVSFDSESEGTTLNIGVDGGIGSSSGWRPVIDESPS